MLRGQNFVTAKELSRKNGHITRGKRSSRQVPQCVLAFFGLKVEELVKEDVNRQEQFWREMRARSAFDG